MISIAVRYHNLLRRTTGLAEETVALGEGTSVGDLLLHLAQRHGAPLREMLLEPEGGISLHLVVFCNQRLVRRDGYDGLLSHGDEMMLFPAISGG